MNFVVVLLFTICVSYYSTATKNPTLDILKELLKDKSRKHVVFSTLSIKLTYGMALLGAEGETESKIREILFDGEARTKIESDMLEIMETLAGKGKDDALKLANLVVLHRDLEVKQKFTDSLKKIYNTAVSRQDFTTPTRHILNNYVRKITKGGIKAIVDHLNFDAKFVLLDALSFKGEWEEKFDKTLTFDYVFSEEDNTRSECRYMSDTRMISVASEEEYEIGFLPFTGGYSMYIYLPNIGYTLEEVIRHFPNNRTYTFKDEKRKLLFPRVKLTSEIDVKKILSQLGMVEPFSENANFQGMTDENVCIDQSGQEIEIEFDEKGAKAAAATHAINLGTTSEAYFYLNRPFFFTIFDEEFETTLFAGFLRSMKK